MCCNDLFFFKYCLVMLRYNLFWFVLKINCCVIMVIVVYIVFFVGYSFNINLVYWEIDWVLFSVNLVFFNWSILLLKNMVICFDLD